MRFPFAIRTNIAFTQAKGCRFCLHLRRTVFYFGRKRQGIGARLELFTPEVRLRWSPATSR